MSDYEFNDLEKRLDVESAKKKHDSRDRTRKLAKAHGVMLLDDA